MSQIKTKFITDLAITNAKVATGIDAAKLGSGAVSNTEFGYLDGVTSAIQTQFTGKVDTSLLGVSLGVATLDAGGKIPAAQLPSSVMSYLGTWAASTNTPTLANGTGDAGDVYISSNAGTVNFGAGAITFAAGDWAVYSGSVWQKSINSNAVASVNGFTGAVVLTTTDVAQGTNLYFTTAAAQASITGGASSIVTSNLGFNFALVSSGAGKVTVSAVTSTELGYSSGVTSAIQTQLNGKQSTITVLPIANGGTNSSTALNNNRVLISNTGAIIENAAITASRALASDANGLPVAATTTTTELNFVNGVTSAIQTQLNSKQATLTIGNFTDVGTDGITVTGGTGSVIGSGTSISQRVSDTTHNGYLSSTDWNTFNNKQGTITTGNLTDAGTDGIVVTGGTGAVVGTGTSIAQSVADSTHNGYLSSTDWATFNGKQASGSYATTDLANLGTTAINADLIFNKSSALVKTKDNAAGVSTAISFKSGSTTVGNNVSGLVTVSSGDSAAGTSGNTAISTGTANGATGNIDVTTGASSAAGSGALTLSTGTGAAATSGAVAIASGSKTGAGAGSTGQVTVQTGDYTGSSNGVSGLLNIKTGAAGSSATNAATGAMTIQTGNSASTSGSNTTGNLTIQTGNQTGAGSTSPTGNLIVRSGDKSGAGAAISGTASFGSGLSPNSTTGSATFTSGDGGGSGVTTFGSGNATGAASGTATLKTGTGTSGSGIMTIQTGTASAGTSGALNGTTGAGTTGTGAISFTSGNASAGNSGAVTLQSGTASGTRGNIVLNGLSIDASSTKIINVTDPTNPQEAATKAYADTKQTRSTITAKGSLYAGTASNTTAELVSGANGTFLQADSAQSTGLSYGTPATTYAIRSVTTTDAPSATADATLNCSGASFTITFPTPAAGKIYTVTHNGTNFTQVYTLATTAGATIGGVASGSYALYTTGESITIQFDGTNFQIINRFTSTAWAVYTPTYTGFGTVTVTDFQWRRIGDSMELQGRFTSGTVTSTEARVSTPGGLNVNTIVGTLRACGPALMAHSSGTGYLNNTTTLMNGGLAYVTFQAATSSSATNANAATDFGSAAAMSFTAVLPIANFRP